MRPFRPYRPYRPYQAGVRGGEAPVVPLFRDDLTDLALDASGTFTRASAAYLQHFASGLWVPVLSGELRWKNARRVYNQASATETWVGWSAPIKNANGSVSGATLTITPGAPGYVYHNNGASYPAGTYARISFVVTDTTLSGNGCKIRFAHATVGSQYFPCTAAGRYSLIVGPSGNAGGYNFGLDNRVTDAGGDGTSGGSVTFSNIQIEDVTAQVNRNPSEFVAKEAHNARVTGVKYFATENGTTVNGTTGIVTEATGAALTGPFGLLMEPVTTNRLTYSNDLTNAAWTASNCTVAKNAAGIDGYSTSACTLTATANDATVIRASAYTAASATHATKWWIKRKTGTGTVELTLDNGSTWQDITSQINGTTYTGIAVDQASLENPQVGIRLRTNTDAVYVGNALLREAAAKETIAAASPIFTTTAAVARAVDALSYSSIAADNEARLVIDGANVDLADDWNGAVAAPTVPEVLSDVIVYAPGERPA